MGRCTTSRLVEGSSGSRGVLEVSSAFSDGSPVGRSGLTWGPGGIGSGSTYVYGYCDATYKDKMNEEETVTFVKNSKWPEI